MKNETNAEPWVCVEWLTVYEQAGRSMAFEETLGQFADRMNKLGYSCFNAQYTNLPLLRLKEAIQKRIEQLNTAGEKFGEVRFDESISLATRELARVGNDKIEFARHELQELLKLIP